MAKKKPADIRLYTDGSYYQKTSALGSAWIRANKDIEEDRRGYNITAADDNKAGSLLAEIVAVSEGLRQLTRDVGDSKVTVYTDCKDIMLAIANSDYKYRAGKAKRESLANAWSDLDENAANHEVDAIWVKNDNEPRLLEAHKMAQTSANFGRDNDDDMVYHFDIEPLDLNAPQ